MQKPTNQYPIQLIEDDEALAQSIMGLLSSLQYTYVHYRNAEDFLDTLKNNPEAMKLSSCVISDVRLPDQTGLDILTILKRDYPKCVWPIILITGHGDIAMAVDALHHGALDFLTKPFDPFILINKIAQAVEKSQVTKMQQDFLLEYTNRLTQLTEHEKAVFEMMMRNLSNREIADHLGNSTRTIEVHRAAVFKKMDVQSAMQLAQQNERYEMIVGNITNKA
jgi:two-component system response regulator FixJ